MSAFVPRRERSLEWIRELCHSFARRARQRLRSVAIFASLASTVWLRLRRRWRPRRQWRRLHLKLLFSACHLKALGFAPRDQKTKPPSERFISCSWSPADQPHFNVNATKMQSRPKRRRLLTRTHALGPRALFLGDSEKHKERILTLPRCACYSTSWRSRGHDSSLEMTHAASTNLSRFI